MPPLQDSAVLATFQDYQSFEQKLPVPLETVLKKRDDQLQALQSELGVETPKELVSRSRLTYLIEKKLKDESNSKPAPVRGLRPVPCLASGRPTALIQHAAKLIQAAEKVRGNSSMSLNLYFTPPRPLSFRRTRMKTTTRSTSRTLGRRRSSSRTWSR